MGTLINNICHSCQDAIEEDKNSYQYEKKNELLSIISNEQINIIPKKKNEFNEKKLYGFNNPQNDCFMNASLQLLTHIDELTYFIKKCCENENEKDNQLKNKYYNIIKEIEEGNGNKIINGKAIKEEIGKLDERFQTNQQQDASEFISFFIGRLLEETQGTKDINSLEEALKELDELEKEGFNRLWKRFFLRKGKSYIVDLFYGILKVETRNKKDDRLESIRFNMFNILELPIYYLLKESKSNVLSMDKILHSFFKDKKDNDDGQTYEMTSIMKLPKYLLIFFNRSVDEDYLDNKIIYNEHISMKTYLSLSKHMNNTTSSYSLESIIEYTGNSKSGHYTAICKISNENWYRFSDSFYDINRAQFNSNDAMILLYKMNSLN